MTKGEEVLLVLDVLLALWAESIRVKHRGVAEPLQMGTIISKADMRSSVTERFSISLSVLLTEGCLNSLCTDDWGACFVCAVAQSFTKLALHPSAGCSDGFCKLILGPVSALPLVLAEATAVTPVCKFHCQGYSAWMTQLLIAIRHKSHKGPLCHEGQKMQDTCTVAALALKKRTCMLANREQKHNAIGTRVCMPAC